MVDFIKSANPARKYIVPCLQGPTGIGKTAATKQAALELKDEGKASGKVITIIASQILPNEVSGITMPVPESKAMEIFDHYRLSSLQDGDILFFDELLEADQLVLSACLTLIESRQLMSGHELPDVMIVAATNPTIKPNMLKENIRQRFVWRRFDIDRYGCREYIERICGFEISIDAINQLADTGDEYNILTPRSLTKMCQWISSVTNRDEVYSIAEQINSIWQSSLGSLLAESYLKVYDSPLSQVRRAVRISLDQNNVSQAKLDDISEGMGAIMYDDDAFEQTSMTELIEVLQQLPEWKEIEKQLSSTVMQENNHQVNF
jgi:hypothetical protein